MDTDVSLVSGLVVFLRHIGDILDTILKFQILLRREFL